LALAGKEEFKEILAQNEAGKNKENLRGRKKCK